MTLAQKKLTHLIVKGAILEDAALVLHRGVGLQAVAQRAIRSEREVHRASCLVRIGQQPGIHVCRSGEAEHLRARGGTEKKSIREGSSFRSSSEVVMVRIVAIAVCPSSC